MTIYDLAKGGNSLAYTTAEYLHYDEAETLLSPMRQALALLLVTGSRR